MNNFNTIDVLHSKVNVFYDDAQASQMFCLCGSVWMYASEYIFLIGKNDFISVAY